MEAWQLAVLALPAVVFVLSVVMVVRKVVQLRAARPVGRRAALGESASLDHGPRPRRAK